MQAHRQRARVSHAAGRLYRPLPPAFYARPVLELARALLGKLLVRRRDDEREPLLVGRIVEAEAYAGRLDPASHSFRGMTARCATMFGPGGRLYVYFTYGNHHCANVVGGSRRDAAAVLLRAVEPIAGLAALRRGRLARTKPGATADALDRGDLDAWLARGPGNLAACFGLDRGDDGADLTTTADLWIAVGPAPRRVLWTPRVGLGDNPAAHWLWRCVDAESGAATRVPASWPAAARPSPSLGQLRAAARDSTTRASAAGP